MSEENGADVNLEVGGQKIAVRNVKSLNTLATVATLIMVICMAVIGYQMLDAHAQHSVKNTDTLISVLKEQAVAQRVTNCLMATVQEQREAKLATCERIAR